MVLARLGLRKSITSFLLLTWQTLSGNPEEQSTGSPTICLSTALSEMELHFKVSQIQPLALQNIYPSLKYQVVFSYPHNILIWHSVCWKSPIQHSSTCIRIPVIVLVQLSFSFQFIDYISELTSNYLSPPCDTSHLCLPDWLVYYALHSPDDLQIAWYLSQACFWSVMFIRGVLQLPPAASPFAVLCLPLLKMSTLEKGKEIFCKKISYLLWVHTHDS